MQGKIGRSDGNPNSKNCNFNLELESQFLVAHDGMHPSPGIWKLTHLLKKRSSMIMPKRLGGSMLMLTRRGSMIMLKRLGSMMIMLKRMGFNDHAEEFMTGRHCWKIHGYVFCCNPQYAT